MNLQFQVDGMSCAHCAQAVTDAVQAIDPSAQVTVDVGTGHVAVLSEHPRESVRLAIENAGYRAA